MIPRTRALAYAVCTFLAAAWGMASVTAAPPDEKVAEKLAEIVRGFDPDRPDSAAAAHESLSGLARAVAGKEAERRALVMALLSRLDPETPRELRVLFIDEVGRLGKYEAVRPLGDILAAGGDMAVREAARRALESIPVVTVKRALRDALGSAEGPLRVGILRSLGARRDALAMEPLLEASKAADLEVRLAAIEAMALIGEISAVGVLEEALEEYDGAALLRVRRAYVRLADALVENSERGTARRIYDRAMGLGTPERCAALIGFARAGLQSEVQRIVTFAASDNAEVRGAALEAAVILPGPGMTSALIAALDASREATVREELLRALARRGDVGSMVKLLSIARSEEENEDRARVVRLLGGLEAGIAAPRDAAPLLPVLLSALEAAPAVRAAAAAALARLPGEGVTQAIAERLSAARARERVELADILGARRDAAGVDRLLAVLEDEAHAVRIAAVRALGRIGSERAVPSLVGLVASADGEISAAAETALGSFPAALAGEPLLAAARTSGGDRVLAAYVRILGRLRHEPAIPLLLEAARSETPELRLAALGGLALSDDARAIQVLEQALTEGSKEEEAVAVRGVLRQAAALAASDPEKAVEIYAAALSRAQRDEDVRVALQGLGEHGGPRAVEAVALYLKPGPMARDAGRAALRLAERLGASDRERAVAVLRQVLELDVDDATATQCVRRLRRLGVEVDPAGSRGFVTHFWILAPLADPGETDWQDALGFAAEVDLARPLEHQGETLSWKHYHTPHVFGAVDLERAGYRGDATGALLYAEVSLSATVAATLKLGSDDSVACWLNGEKVHANKTNRGLSRDQDSVDVELRRGTNRFLLRVTNASGGWGACLRLTDRQGKPLRFEQKQE